MGKFVVEAEAHVAKAELGVGKGSDNPEEPPQVQRR
jgi:hypothetical protein